MFLHLSMEGIFVYKVTSLSQTQVAAVERVLLMNINGAQGGSHNRQPTYSQQTV